MAQGNYTRETAGLVHGSFIFQRVQITSSKTSGQILSVQNPEGFLPNNISGAGTGAGDIQDGLGWLDQYRTPGEVMAKEFGIVIRNKSAAACTLDFGVGPSATGDYTQGLSAQSVAAAPANTIYNTVRDGATQGNRVYVAPGDYFNVTVKTGDANGLVADFFVEAALMNEVLSP